MSEKETAVEGTIGEPTGVIVHGDDPTPSPDVAAALAGEVVVYEDENILYGGETPDED